MPTIFSLHLASRIHPQCLPQVPPVLAAAPCSHKKAPAMSFRAKPIPMPPSSKHSPVSRSHLRFLIVGLFTHILLSTVAVSADLGSREIFSLRSMQHKDREGKIISKSLGNPRQTVWPHTSQHHARCSPIFPADPDLSNPTRPRLERPLDTIRGFEAAIESTRKQNRI